MTKAYTKLLQVQAKLRAPKDCENTFGGYKYRKAEDILEAVKPLLVDVGAIVTISDNVTQVGDRFYVTSTATFTDVEDATMISVSAMARESLAKKGMDEAQITGSASSYARKYALNGLFAIDDSDTDPDVTNTHNADANGNGAKTPVESVTKDKPNNVTSKKPNTPSGVKQPVAKSPTDKIKMDSWNQFRAYAKQRGWDEKTRNAEWSKILMDEVGTITSANINMEGWNKVLNRISVEVSILASEVQS